MAGRRTDLRRAIVLSVATIVWNGVAGVSAVVVALSTGSLSLLGFGFDAAVDSVASVALVWRFSVEREQPERADQVERIAAAVVSAVLTVLGVYLAIQSVRALLMHAEPDRSTAAVALLVASAIVLPPLGIAKRRVAARLRSAALRGDSILTLVAALLAGVGLASAVLSTALGLWWADAAGGLVVAAILLREGLGGLRELRRRTAG